MQAWQTGNGPRAGFHPSADTWQSVIGSLGSRGRSQQPHLPVYQAQDMRTRYGFWPASWCRCSAIRARRLLAKLSSGARIVPGGSWPPGLLPDIRQLLHHRQRSVSRQPFSRWPWRSLIRWRFDPPCAVFLCRLRRILIRSAEGMSVISRLCPLEAAIDPVEDAGFPLSRPLAATRQNKPLLRAVKERLTRMESKQGKRKAGHNDQPHNVAIHRSYARWSVLVWSFYPSAGKASVGIGKCLYFLSLIAERQRLPARLLSRTPASPP